LLLLLACEVIGAATISLALGQPMDETSRRCDLMFASRAAVEAGTPRTIVIAPDWLPARGEHSLEADLAVLMRPVVPERIARITRTSGTTGVPKAIPLTFGTSQLRIDRTVADMPPHLPPAPCMLCLYHLATGSIHRRVLTTLQLGGTVLFLPARHTWPLIAAGTVHYLAIAVGDLERTIGDASPPPPGHPLHVMAFGAAVSRDLRQLARRRLNATIENSYASNETNLIAMIDDDNTGTLCAGVEVRIVDDLGRELPFGEAGLIHVKSDTVVSGYYNDPALTAACFVDGWFHTSDVGFMPEAGKLVVLGRADGMLNIGGVKVAPTPIEEQIKQIDGISDAAVIGTGGASEAGMLLAAVEIGDDPLPPETGQRIATIIARYIGVFRIMPMREFPRTDSGKVKRPEIEAAFRRSG
jgi:acyl-coenzyme A synthetase/AMP-(fatty) acid ligase